MIEYDTDITLDGAFQYFYENSVTELLYGDPLGP